MDLNIILRNTKLNNSKVSGKNYNFDTLTYSKKLLAK
jgi:hypothetical protein